MKTLDIAEAVQSAFRTENGRTPASLAHLLGVASADDAGEPGVRAAPIYHRRENLAGPVDISDDGLTARTLDEQPNTIRWVLSDETPDRMGDIIRAAGWDTRNFANNPVVLWAHDYSSEPLGRITSLEKTIVRGVPALVGSVEFAVDASEVAARRFRLAKAGFLRAGSVGFLPQETLNVDDPAERSRLGLGRHGVVYVKQELLEFSLVPVPANPQATQLALKSGLVDATDLEFFEARLAEQKQRQAKAAESLNASLTRWAKAPDYSTTTGSTCALIMDAHRGAASTATDQALAPALAKALEQLAAGQSALAHALTDLGGQLIELRKAIATAAVERAGAGPSVAKVPHHVSAVLDALDKAQARLRKPG